MDADIVRKVKDAIATTSSTAIARAERVRAIYDVAVNKFGVERVGGFEAYADKPSGYWTLERCKESALNYSNKAQWVKNENGAYGAAFKNGWLDQCCEHMLLGKKENGYWTLKKCQESALKYKTRAEWVKGEYAAYRATLKNGWLDQCCAHMFFGKKENGYWTLKRCQESAKKYKTRAEWTKSNHGAYLKAYRRKWLDQCCAHMISGRKENGYWTLERCKESASKYRSVREWCIGEGSAYNVALTNGWIAECCAHMILVSNPHGYWTLERCQESALKYSTKGKWETNEGSAYNKARQKGWIDMCCAHMVKVQNTSGYWTLKKCKESALNYSTKTQWHKNEGGAYYKAQRKGWLDQCCAHMPKRAKRRKIAASVAASAKSVRT